MFLIYTIKQNDFSCRLMSNFGYSHPTAKYLIWRWGANTASSSGSSRDCRAPKRTSPKEPNQGAPALGAHCCLTPKKIELLEYGT